MSSNTINFGRKNYERFIGNGIGIALGNNINLNKMLRNILRKFGSLILFAMLQQMD